MAQSTLIVVNRRARNVRLAGRWLRRQSEALERLAPAELALLDSPEEAELAAFEGAQAGYGRLVVVGDLATASGFVNGLMRLAESHRRALRVGFLSLGRHNGWCEALALPADVGRQLDILSAGNVLPYDVGRVDCVDAEGKTTTRHFLAGVALEGSTGDTTLTCDDTVAHAGQWTLGYAMLTGRYPGAGTIAPEANPSDGLLDVAWIASTGARAALAKLTTTLHLPSGLARERAREVRIECPGFRVPVRVDGIAAGQLPATVTVLPRALPVIVEPIASRLREKQKKMVTEMQGAALAGHFKRVARR